MQRWEHCRLEGNNLHFLGAGLLENRKDRHLTERGAWDQIYSDGWELVSVVPDPESGPHTFYFKRPAQDE